MGRRSRGFTLIELLIVMVIIALLAALLLPALTKAICAAKETHTADIIHNIETGCEMYNRDFNTYPPSNAGPPFASGPVAFYLGKPGPKKQPYMQFRPDDLSDGADPPTMNSNIRNKVDSTDQIRYRNNTMNPPPSATPPIRNKYKIDLWAKNCDNKATGINNWNKPE